MIINNLCVDSSSLGNASTEDEVVHLSGVHDENATLLTPVEAIIEPVSQVENANEENKGKLLVCTKIVKI